MRAVAIIVVVLVCGVAHADKQAAEKLFSAGAKAYAAQNFGAAAQYFDEAYKELPMPEIAFSAAQAYRRLYRVDPNPQHVKRAVELYRIYLDKVKTGGRVGDASDSLGEMERELDKLEAKGKVRLDAVVEHTRLGVNITITDQTTPDASTLREIGEGTGKALEGVTATLDGKPIEPSALVDVAAGEHTVAVSAPGYFPVEKRQRVVQGVTSLVDVELRPRPAKVTVQTEPGAKLMIDGRPVAGPVLELATGRHQLAVLRNGREPFGRELVVTRGQELTLAAPLEKTGRRRAVKWVIGGAGALTLLCALDGIAAVVADNKAIDLRDQIRAGNAAPSLADDYDHQIQQRDRFRTASIVFGGGALIAGAVGLGLYFFDTPSPAKLETKLQLAPAVGPGMAGVTALRRF